ncbi:protein NATD1-like [Hylaeus anthracinus]|uniref:protein NATD1-like n=1 Tax=Hylaeus anthracinus TaxID=313031 RepID=UPI0023B92249|nr:protein NATD1-like [Hylaeus anthracinus]
MNYVNTISSFILKQTKRNQYARFLYTVQHNEKRGLFYVKLDDNSKAVLHYVAEGKVLDMQTIAVPYRYTGRGLARLLAETAFTHAIVNHYYMYLTCEYMQKYYLAIKNPDLEERIVGPPHILEGPDSEPLDPDIIYELPDPEDFLIYSS